MKDNKKSLFSFCEFKDNFAQAKDEVVSNETIRPVLLEEELDELTTQKVAVLYEKYKKGSYGEFKSLTFPIKMLLIGGESREERGRIIGRYAYVFKDEEPFWRFIFPGLTRNEEDPPEVAKQNFHMLLDKEIQELKHWVDFTIPNIKKELALYENFKLNLAKFE